MADLSYYAEHGPVPGFSLVTDGPFPVNFAQKGGLNLYLHLPTGPVLKSLTGGVAINAVPSSAQVLLGDAHPAAITAKISALPAGLREDLDVVAGPDGTELHARGRSGHAAFPEGTRNAILVLARALVEAELVGGADLAAARLLATILATPYGDGSGVAYEDEVSGKLTQNGGVVRPEGDGISLHIDIRYPVTASSQDIRRTFRELLAPMGGSLVNYDDAAPFYIDPHGPVVQLLQMSSAASPASMHPRSPWAAAPTRACSQAPSPSAPASVTSEIPATTARHPTRPSSLPVTAPRTARTSSCEWMTSSPPSAFMHLRYGA